MVVDVPEELRQLLAHLDVRAALERLEWRQQRMDGAVEIGGLAAQEVDPLGGRGRSAEHGLLDLLDVLLEALDHRCVVIDDRVEDRPQDRRRALLEQFGPLLEPFPRAVEVARLALADGDHEPTREEHRDLADVHHLAVLDVTGGAQHHEQNAALLVALDLRAQVEVLSVLDRQIVQAESVLHLVQLVFVRLEQSEPHEPLVLQAELGGLLQRHRGLVLTLPIPVKRTVDDHVDS